MKKYVLATVAALVAAVVARCAIEVRFASHGGWPGGPRAEEAGQ
jgi:hypothetical protein